jgi:hypothetical protein
MYGGKQYLGSRRKREAANGNMVALEDGPEKFPAEASKNSHAVADAGAKVKTAAWTAVKRCQQAHRSDRRLSKDHGIRFVGCC